MLDGLDDIDWARLGHAYGAADDVPGQLRALLSLDPATRDEALGDLYTNVFHQGNRFEASAYVVPFLLEMLADPATPDPARLPDVGGERSLTVLGRSTEPWLIDGQEFGNVAELVGGYGLPKSRETMLAYLGRVP
ncbi:hypothetical protein [Micromonospora sp. WMMD710]|uniref:hypothetical protein n=1 Tax=Micromonospora sp. WMMD710 TaxID=3016085 RepID=UPI0024163242|nr:hypothetical protein [Micromonospora sp. WMMD710]MDG4757500.1 hypothetical protein [Micromonospora sp. WMMD710]